MQLLDKPAPGVTQPTLVAQLMQHLALYGECFVGKVKPSGTIEALEALDPSRVQVEIRDGAPVYQYTSPMGMTYSELTVSDVLHIRGMTAGVRGISPIGMCRQALDLANNLTTAASALWANGALPSGILKVPSGPGAQDQAEALSKAWQARHGGTENRGLRG